MSKEDPDDTAVFASVPAAMSGQFGADGGTADMRFGVPEPERYAEQGMLGRGGMGDVRCVRDQRLHRDVARKVARDPSGEAALFREAVVTAGLDHPGIVPVYDAGQDSQGRLFYTMRVVRGKDLAAVLKDTPMPRVQGALLRHFLDACEAMAFAHSMGVVHRDLKPANILVGEFGETQVADWGLAQRSDHADMFAALRVPPVPDGVVVGTPSYMSPEQARGEWVDARADVYALGTVLYEIVCGELPLAGNSSAEKRTLLRSDPPAPDVAGVPPDLAAIVQRALAPKAEDRYPSALELAADLASWMDGRRVAAYEYSPWELLTRLARAWSGPLAAGTVAGVIILAIALAAWWQTLMERDRALLAEHEAVEARDHASEAWGRMLVQQAVAASGAGDRVTAELLAAKALTLVDDPDAKGVLATWAAAPRPQMLEQHALPDCISVRLSARGQVELCQKRDHTWMWLGEHPTPMGAAVDLVRLAGGHGWVRAIDRYTVAWEDEAGAERLRRDGVKAATGLVAHPEAPVAVGIDRANLVWHDLERGLPIELVPCPGAVVLKAAFAPDGRLVAACEDGRIAEVAPGVPAQLIGQLGDDGSVTAMAWSDQTLWLGTLRGVLIALDTQDGSVVRYQQPGLASVRHIHPAGNRVAVTDLLGRVSVVRVPGGELEARLPVAALQAWLGDDELRIIGADREQRWSLTPAGAPYVEGGQGVASVALSPDGQRAAAAHGDGTVRLWDPPSAGIAQAQWQTLVAKDVAFSPDGTRVVASALGGDHGLRVLDAGSGDVISVHAAPNGLIRLVWLPEAIVGATYGDHVLVWRDDKPAEVLNTPRIVDLETAPGGRRAAYLDHKGTVGWLDLSAPTVLQPVTTRAQGFAVAALPSGELLVASVGQVEVIGDQPRFFDALEARLLDVAASADGRFVAAGALDGRTLVWDASTGELLARLYGHRERVASVALGPGGRVVTGSWDKRAHTHDLSPLSADPVEQLEALEAAWGRTADDVSRDALQAHHAR